MGRLPCVGVLRNQDKLPRNREEADLFFCSVTPLQKCETRTEDLTADQMVCLKVHPGKGKYVDYRRISRYRIGPKFKPRTYYVHEESRDVHSVGKVRLFFSTTKAP